MGTCKFENVRSIVEGERLVGRDDVCVEIMQYLRAGSSCAIVGLRHIGKSSVLNKIKNQLVSNGELVVSTNLQKCSGESNMEARFYTRAVKRLVEAYGGKVVPSIEDDAYDAFDLLVRRIFLDRGGKKLFFLIDEFDSCTEMCESVMGGFLNRLRALIDESLENGLVVLLASSRAIPMLESKTMGFASTLNAKLHPIDLLPFDEVAFNQLCDLSAREVTEQTRKKYFERSFGHPFLASLLLRDHNKISSDDVVDAAENGNWVDVVISGSNFEYESYFDELKNLFSSFHLRDDMVSNGIANWFDCLVWRELYGCMLPEHVLTTFQKYGFWTHGTTRMPEVLHEFLARRRTDVWKELKQMETRFRRLVGDGLEYYWGSKDWFLAMELPKAGSDEDPWRRDYKRENKSFQEIVKEKFKRTKKSMPDVDLNYLDCTYLDDLLNLMRIQRHWCQDKNHNWLGFGSYFDNDREKCKEEVLAAGKVRNHEAHFVEYPQMLKVRFKEAIDYLTGVLDRAEKMGFKIK